MAVIDWLQTSEFIRRKIISFCFKLINLLNFFIENSESFILYALCGCFVGITIILMTVIIVLYIEKRRLSNDDSNKLKNDYQIPRSDIEYNDILSTGRSYLPVYHYDARTHHDFYQV